MVHHAMAGVAFTLCHRKKQKEEGILQMLVKQAGIEPAPANG